MDLFGGVEWAWVDGFRPQCSREHVGITANLARDLRSFSFRSPGDYTGNTHVGGPDSVHSSCTDYVFSDYVSSSPAKLAA